MSMFKVIGDAFFGPSQARAAHRQALKQAPGIARGISLLESIAPARPEDDDAPIFLLSAGWRSGSTMLQRLLMSDPDVLIWGEPYDECGPTQAMAEGMKAFRAGWPPPEYFYDGTATKQLSGEWIANLFPDLDAWRRAHRAFFDTLFAEPARRAGAKRWGIKEVRLTADHAHYLRWLYPRARFLLLYRDPLEAYRSYCAYGRSWYDTFPDRPVLTPTQFGNHWRRMMEGYVREHKALDGRLVCYEDLVAGKVSTEDLDTYLGTRVDRAVLDRKIGGASDRGPPRQEVHALERWLLRRAVGPVASEMGYRR